MKNMGMFDYVILSFKCPKCSYSESRHDWQTKALDNCLFRYGAGYRISPPGVEIDAGAIDIHTICPKCNNFISAKTAIRKSIMTGKVEYSTIRAIVDSKIKSQARRQMRQMAKPIKLPKNDSFPTHKTG